MSLPFLRRNTEFLQKGLGACGIRDGQTIGIQKSSIIFYFQNLRHRDPNALPPKRCLLALLCRGPYILSRKLFEHGRHQPTVLPADGADGLWPPPTSIRLGSPHSHTLPRTFSPSFFICLCFSPFSLPHSRSAFCILLPNMHPHYQTRTRKRDAGARCE